MQAGKCCQVGPAKREFGKLSASNLDWLAGKVSGTRSFIKLHSRILFQHPNEHAGETSLEECSGQGGEKSLSNPAALGMLEQVQRIEFRIVPVEGCTDGTATAEPDHLTFNLGYEHTYVTR